MPSYIQVAKITALLHSRKFWSLITALLVDGFGVYDKVSTPEVAILAAVGTLAAYMVATGVESAGQSNIAAAAISAHATIVAANVAAQPLPLKAGTVTVVAPPSAPSPAGTATS